MAIKFTITSLTSTYLKMLESTHKEVYYLPVQFDVEGDIEDLREKTDMKLSINQSVN